jgi:hypothetical protein
MVYLYDACDQISDFCHQQLHRGKRFWIHQIPTSCLPILLIFIHIEHICTFFVAFFSATVDDRNLIFGHKLHIGMPYCGKRFQISAINSCWEKCDEKCAYMFNAYKNQQSRQTGSRNLTGPKTLPPHWERQHQNRHMTGPAWVGLSTSTFLLQP